MTNDILQNEGLTATDLYCHSCQGNFIAQIDYSLNGNHEIHCPRCDHIHYRKVEDGRVTGDRWGSDLETYEVKDRNTWVSSDNNISTTTVSMFLREKWLNKVQ